MRVFIIIFNICLLLVVNFNSKGFSQILVGKTINNNKKPVPYVNIGVPGGKYGTISNVHGEFSINLDNIKVIDTIRFSSIGYNSKDFTKQDLLKKEGLIVQLDEISYTLNEVRIYPNLNMTSFGKRKHHNNGGFGFGDFGIGYELARLFLNNEKHTLNEFYFHIRFNDYDSILFRVNVYSRQNNHPNRVINQFPLLIKTNIRNGWVKCDLSSANIKVEGDFYISVEGINGWCSDEIEEIKTIQLILSGNHDMKSITYIRRFSHAGWEEVITMMDYYLTVY